jgi:hypothetical protein
MILPDVVLYGGYQAGAYSHVEPVTIQSQHGQVVVVDGQPKGSGGYVDWCLLAADKKGKVSCWAEQSGDRDKYIQKSLRAGELVDAWDLEAKDGHLFIQSSVWASADPNCCPTHGTIRIALAQNNGVLSWGQVTRSVDGLTAQSTTAVPGADSAQQLEADDSVRVKSLNEVAAIFTSKAAQQGSHSVYTACRTDPPEQATLCVMDVRAPDDGFPQRFHSNVGMGDFLYKTGFRRMIVGSGTEQWQAQISSTGLGSFSAKSSDGVDSFPQE